MHAALHFLSPPTCTLCRHPVNNTGLCTLCSESLHQSLWTPALSIQHIDQVHVLGDYSLSPGRLVRLAKYGKREDAARILGAAIGLAAKRHQLQAEVVVPVPQSWTKSLWRGFSPVELMAQDLGKALGQPVRNALGRKRGRSMAGVASRHRTQIAKSQFFVRKTPTRDRVLLIDDVLTTGATASACAALLKSKGVKEVHLIAAASPLI